MKSINLLTACTFLSLFVVAQKKAGPNQLGFSLPVIRNNTSITNDYGLVRTFEGAALSYGLNLHYSRKIYKGLSLRSGIGYFRQKFGVQRPFNYDDFTNLLFYTKHYHYDNIHWLLGLGYEYRLSSKYALTGDLTYNGLYAYRGTFTPDFQGRKPQVVKNDFSFGRMVNIGLGLNRTLCRRFSVGAGILLPVYTQWRKDNIFWENDHDFYASISNIGMNISFNHHF
jgi:hypothetical protein